MGRVKFCEQCGADIKALDHLKARGGIRAVA